MWPISICAATHAGSVIAFDMVTHGGNDGEYVDKLGVAIVAEMVAIKAQHAPLITHL